MHDRTQPKRGVWLAAAITLMSGFSLALVLRSGAPVIAVVVASAAVLVSVVIVLMEWLRTRRSDRDT
jgi:uncharacterized paraquat-inducible protein A